MFCYETIPSNLDDLQPGPELGGVSGCIDVEEVSPYDRVIVMRAHDRQRSHHDAERYRAMTAVVDGMGIDDPRWATEAAAGEIQASLHLTRRATETELSYAVDLQRRLPQVWTALVEGLIDVWRAKTIIRATEHLSVAAAQQVVERVIEAAPNLTTGELKARLGREVIEVDPQGAGQRYEHRVKDSRLIVESTTDGSANLLGLDLPPHKVSAASRRVNHLARSLKTRDETRTMDQLSADVYLDLLLGARTGDKSSSGGGTHIHTDLDTLVGLAAHSGRVGRVWPGHCRHCPPGRGRTRRGRVALVGDRPRHRRRHP